LVKSNPARNPASHRDPQLSGSFPKFPGFLIEAGTSGAGEILAHDNVDAVINPQHSQRLRHPQRLRHSQRLRREMKGPVPPYPIQAATPVITIASEVRDHQQTGSAACYTRDIDKGFNNSKTFFSNLVNVIN
jgi:hypothetical protein